MIVSINIRNQMLPVRCFSCCAVVSIFWTQYQELVNSGVDKTIALDQVRIGSRKLERPCCRSMIISYVDTDAPIFQKAMVKDYADKMTTLANEVCALGIAEKSTNVSFT